MKLDGDAIVVMPAEARVRIEPPASPLEIETRAYRGALEMFGNSRRTLTVVNELPLEDYLRGVVPNELNPAAFGQIEALKAQAVAARTYIQRNLGQYKKEGYDICATDACQVYLGVLTEDALATQAVMETRGVVATYDGQADQRALQLHLRRPDRGRGEHLQREGPVPGVRQLRVQAPRRCRSRRRDRFPTGRTACSRLRGSRTSAMPRGSWALRIAAEPASTDPAASPRSSARRSIRRC